MLVDVGGRPYLKEGRTMKFTASKKTIALVAAAAMLTSVAACGSSSNSSSSGVTEGGKTEITVWS